MIAVVRLRPSGIHRSPAASCSARSIGRRGHQRDPEAAVGRERLLRREVVDVAGRHVDVDAAGTGRGVDQHQGVVGRAVDAVHRRHHAGGRLVVRPAVGVDAGLGQRRGPRPGHRGDDRRVGEERGGGGARGELGGELAEGEVLRALADQAERGDVPEQGRAAVAQDHLVALGQREQLGQTGSHPPDHLPHGRLPVRRAEQAGGHGADGVDLLGAHLARPRAEPAVARQEVDRDVDLRGARGHAPILPHALRPAYGSPVSAAASPPRPRPGAGRARRSARTDARAARCASAPARAPTSRRCARR